jgi:prepilin-type N-terminal cleavage/methylation domain-containing protein
MSVACRSEGFTLLEILFVLFIGGLLVALVGPRFGGRMEAYEQDYRFRAIEDDLRQLPRRARLMGKPLELPRDLALSDLGDGRPALALPEGWQLTAAPALQISPFGACSGARVSVRPADVESSPRHYEIASPGCDLGRAPDA